MTFAHMLYIPLSVAIGLALGWYLGTRAVRSEWERAEKRKRDREEGRTPG